MDTTTYLNRINYHGPLDPTSETLRALHLAHMLAVPFENLDIGLGRPIVLDQAALFDKIVVRRRGGFCYELNGLFAGLLCALGFDVTMLAAGVTRDDGSFGPEFDHLTLLVQSPLSVVRGPLQQTTDDTQSAMAWLADVGFGDSFREPLRFDVLAEQPQDGLVYQIVRDEEALILRQRDGEDPWEPLYRFTPRPRRHADFADMCQYHQTSPQSSFTQRRVCTRATSEGRITLSDTRLIITANGERQEQLVADEAEYRSALREHFGIELALGTEAQAKSVKRKT
jgi:N-hydroxyarylamine O-acetyltransferase